MVTFLIGILTGVLISLVLGGLIYVIWAYRAVRDR